MNFSRSAMFFLKKNNTSPWRSAVHFTTETHHGEIRDDVIIY